MRIGLAALGRAVGDLLGRATTPLGARLMTCVGGFMVGTALDTRPPYVATGLVGLMIISVFARLENLLGN